MRQIKSVALWQSVSIEPWLQGGSRISARRAVCLSVCSHLVTIGTQSSPHQDTIELGYLSTTIAPESIYWHDYETTGLDPRCDRPSQFAGLRTDAALREVGEPLVLYCHPAADVLPSPESCLITGITPQRMQRDGVPEREFARAIERELTRAGSCAAAYNGFSFDFEVTRHLLYRNFYDPYAWEWRAGNSRWDPLDALRLARALRPEGIQWADGEDGRPLFQQDRLTQANGIEHEVHEALSDVRTMLALMRLLREHQPKLFNYALARRQREVVAVDLDPAHRKPLLHIDRRYGNQHCCLGVILPLAMAADGERAVWVFDLAHDPGVLLGEADGGGSEVWGETRNESAVMAGGVGRELAQGIADVATGGRAGAWGKGIGTGSAQRKPGLRLLRFNRAPLTAPLGLLNTAAAKRWEIDLAASLERAERLLACSDWAERLPERSVHTAKTVADPESQLYEGFYPDSDRDQVALVPQLDGAGLATAPPRFADRRLQELLFRYRARNYPQTLNAAELERWEAHCYNRLINPDAGARLVMEDYLECLAVLRGAEGLGEAELSVLSALEEHADALLAGG